MGAFGDFVRSLIPGNDHELARNQYAGRESASDRNARIRREKHHARVTRDGDNSGTKFTRRARRNAF